MFPRCIHCRTRFGANTVLPHQPVGRRLAFDQSKGRLWVVCTRCGLWNLTPIEDRWEAIQECADLFRNSEVRVTTPHIGLAQHTGGLDLIRIGDQSVRSEIANWRYGTRLINRYGRWLVGWTLAAVGAGATLTLVGASTHSLVLTAWLAIVAAAWINLPADALQWRTVAELLRPDGSLVQLRAHNLRSGTLAGRGRYPPSIAVSAGGALLKYTGEEAARLLSHLLPRYNRQGGSATDVAAAVALVDQAEAAVATEGGDGAPWEWIAKHGPHGLIYAMPLKHRLALEMAVTEHLEQNTMAAQAVALEDPWRDAETIGAIADNLLVPQFITDWLARRRMRRLGAAA